MSASRSRCAIRSACSPACTSPRWRSGNVSVGSRRIAPTTGRPIASIGVAGQFSVPLAAQPVQHHAGDPYGRIVGRKPLGHRRRRLRLAGHVEHQQHRQAVEPREIGGRAGAPGLRRDAVEQAHGAFDHDDFGVRCRFRGQRAEQSRRHRPAVEVDAGQAGCGGVKAGIDIVRSGFRAAHANSAPGQCAQDADGDRGLAGAGARRADDDRARRHRVSPQLLAQRHDAADDDQGRRDHVFPRRRLDQRAERRDDRAFMRQGRVLDQRRRRSSGSPPARNPRRSRPYASVPYR